MIKKVVVMNLEKRIDKLYFVMGALLVAGFPVKPRKARFSWDEFFVRSISHDGDLYDSVDDVCKAAVADGFEWFSDYCRVPGKEQKYVVAWAWTWGSTLRKIAELDQTVMLLIDDITPVYMWTYMRYCRLAKECAKDPEFKVLQLRTQAGRIPQSLPPVEYFTSLVGKGFMGRCDQGLVLNKAGAELLLEAQATPPIVHPGEDTMKITEWGRKDQRFYDGFYHTLDDVVEVSSIGESNLHPPGIRNLQWV